MSSRPQEDERDEHLPQGEGCFNCLGTGFVEDEAFALDRNGCPDCQEQNYRIVPHDDAQYHDGKWQHFATLAQAKKARTGRDYIERRVGDDGADTDWVRV